MFKKLLTLLALPLAMAACVHGTISDTVGVDNSLSFSVPSETIPAGVVLPPITVSQSVPVNVSDALIKINNIGNVVVTVIDNTITYNGSYAPFKNLTVTLETLNDSVKVMDYTFTGNESGTVNIPFLIGGDELYNDLTQDSVVLLFSITLDPNVASLPSSGTLTVDSHLGLGVSADVTKG